MKFSNKSFGANKVKEVEGFEQEKVFVRDDADNKVLKDIQVKDIKHLITSDCVGAWDFDTPVWKACSNMEIKTIRIKHKTEGVVAEMKNITAFKGRGNSISDSSWLGMQNVDRELEGKEPWFKCYFK